MRAFPSLLLLAALALAGCSAGSDDPNTPPNADPHGGQTLPPVDQNTATISGSPSASSSNTTTTAAATSTTTPAAAPAAASFGPHDEEATANDPEFPGLLVNGRLQGSSTQVSVEVAANNVGERDYKVPDGQCKQPWTETMRGPGGAVVQHREPTPTCGAFGLKAFPSHDFLATALAWDGTLWDAAKGAYVPAPSGSYAWTVGFDAYSGGDSASQYADHAALTLTFHVTVE